MIGIPREMRNGDDRCLPSSVAVRGVSDSLSERRPELRDQARRHFTFLIAPPRRHEEYPFGPDLSLIPPCAEEAGRQAGWWQLLLVDERLSERCQNVKSLRFLAALFVV